MSEQPDDPKVLQFRNHSDGGPSNEVQRRTTVQLVEALESHKFKPWGQSIKDLPEWRELLARFGLWTKG